MRTEPLVVAIDGPAGAGKSTVARRLAKRLGYVLLDTGALYRAVALAAQRAGLSWSDEPAVARLAEDLVARQALRLEPDEELVSGERPDHGRAGGTPGGGGVRVLLEGADVSRDIRTAPLSLGASQISALPTVRQALLQLQRSLGARGGVVVEGRDIGTVVFPDAPVKFFLTAALEERARRRWEELQARGADADLAQTLREVRERDDADRQRAVAPLRQAEDALLVDSTGRGVDEVIEQMLGVVAARGAAR